MYIWSRKCSIKIYLGEHVPKTVLVDRVVVYGEISGLASAKSGVPKGSVLGPLLFLIFINDLAEHATSTVRLLADDCVMYKSVKSVRDCQELQQDLIQLQAGKRDGS